VRGRKPLISLSQTNTGGAMIEQTFNFRFIYRKRRLGFLPFWKKRVDMGGKASFSTIDSMYKELDEKGVDGLTVLYWGYDPQILRGKMKEY
jgi:hypothetical protein